MRLKYRWLEVGKTYRYSAALGKGDDSRRGQLCTVLVVPKPGVVGNVQVKFQDGHEVICPAGVLKAVVQP